VFEESGSDPESLSFALRTLSSLLESGLKDVSRITAIGPGATAGGSESGDLLGSAARRGTAENRIVAIAEGSFQKLDPASQQAARQLLLRMMRIGLGGMDAIVPVDKEEVISQSPDPAGSSAAFAAFVDANLISVRGTSAELASELPTIVAPNSQLD
jgi:hypothetical protein